MPNGHAMNPTLVFDGLLGLAWDKAKLSANAAVSLAAPAFGKTPRSAAGPGSLPDFVPADSATNAAIIAALGDNDRGVAAALQRLAAEWSGEFARIMEVVAPVSGSFQAALDWYGRVMAGGDGLGGVGQHQRLQQSQAAAAQVPGLLNAYGLPLPAGAGAALAAESSRRMAVSSTRLAAQMQADADNAKQQLRAAAIVDVLQLRDQALDAAMDYAFGQINLMFDVFGRNNDYLTELRRTNDLKRARMERLAEELARWRIGVDGDNEAAADDVRITGQVNERYAERVGLEVDGYIKRIRRHSSRAAAALNGFGVSVTSAASESNTVSLTEST